MVDWLVSRVFLWLGSALSWFDDYLGIFIVSL